MKFLKILYFYFVIFLDRIWSKPAIPVLLYHSISEDQSRLAVSPKNFKRQIAYLASKGYECIDPLRLKLALEKKVLPKKKILITFDDGFRDNYLVVYPILKKYNFFATIFLATNFIGKKASFAKNLIDQKRPMLNREEIEKMSQAGFFFANHFGSHLPLTELNKDQITTEYHQAKDFIQSFPGRNFLFNVIAYPKNRNNSSIINQLDHLGVQLAFAGRGEVISKNSQILDLPRIEIFNADSLLKLRAKLTPYYRNFKKNYDF